MPPSADIVCAHYDSLSTVAQKFDTEQHRADQMHQALVRRLNTLRYSWAGTAATAFFQSMDSEILPAIVRLKAALSSGARTTRTIAQRVQTAETEAAALFRGAASAGSTGGGDGGKSEGAPDSRAKPSGGAGGGGGSDMQGTTTMVAYYQETTPEPEPPMSPEQQTQLEELGIVVPEGTVLTEAEAQAIIDFYNANPGLLEAGLTVAEAQEAIEIVNRLEDSGIILDLSPHNPRAWSMEDLRQIDQWVDTLAQNAHDQFIAQFDDPEVGEQALQEVADELGLDNTNDAALRLLNYSETENSTRTIYRDAGVNVVRNSEGDSTDDTVGYTAENTNTVYVVSTFSITAQDGTVTEYRAIYDPDDYSIYSSNLPDTMINNGAIATDYQDEANGGIDRNSRFYGWAFGGGVIVADNLMTMDGGETTTNNSGGEFTNEALFDHELSHTIEFVNTEHSSLLGNSTDGLTYGARTSGSDAEVRADIIMNGLLGTITDSDQQAAYDDYITAVYDDNFEQITGSSIEDYETAQAEAEATPEATPELTPEATPEATDQALIPMGDTVSI